MQNILSRSALLWAMVSGSVAPLGCGKPVPPKPPAPRVAAAAPAASKPSEPASPPPAVAPPSAAPNQRISTAQSDPASIELAGLIMSKPVTWSWQAPSVAFRTLQYSVPATAGRGSAAELVFSMFRAGDGGPLQANIDRWIGQFRTADGAAATPVQCDLTVGEMRVHRIDLAGSYQGMGAAAGRPDWAQLGAIVEAPGANVFIRLLGPQETVEAQRAAFEAMIASLRQTN